MSSEYHGYTREEVSIIDEHRHWKKGIHFGDPAGRFTNQVVNKTVFDVLRENGIHVNYDESQKDFQSRKTAAKMVLRNLVVNDNPRTRDFGYAMENARYPQVRRGGMEEISSVKPLHDWTSHARSSFEYFAVNYQRYKGTRVKSHDKFQSNQFVYYG